MKKNNYITLAKKASDIQINELKKIKKAFNKSFVKAVDLILNCKGKVIFAGVGKSGLIAKKFQLLSQVQGFQVSFVIQHKHFMEIWVKQKKKIF